MTIRNSTFPMLLGAALWFSGCSGIPFAGGSAAPDGPVRSADADLTQRSLADPEEPLWPFRLAENHLATGNAPDAESQLREALSRSPEHAPSLSLLSKLFWDQQRHVEAVELLENARTTTARHAKLRIALALHYEAIEEYDRSSLLLDTVQPTESIQTWLQLRGDDFASAEQAARRAVDENPKSAVNQNNWGITRLYAGEPAAARKAFLTAIDVDPQLPGPLYNLAIVDRFYRFDEDSARQWFQRYLELSQDDPDGLAEILAMKGNQP